MAPTGKTIAHQKSTGQPETVSVEQPALPNNALDSNDISQHRTTADRSVGSTTTESVALVIALIIQAFQERIRSNGLRAVIDTRLNAYLISIRADHKAVVQRIDVLRGGCQAFGTAPISETRIASLHRRVVEPELTRIDRRFAIAAAVFGNTNLPSSEPRFNLRILVKTPNMAIIVTTALANAGEGLRTLMTFEYVSAGTGTTATASHRIVILECTPSQIHILTALRARTTPGTRTANQFHTTFLIHDGLGVGLVVFGNFAGTTIDHDRRTDPCEKIPNHHGIPPTADTEQWCERTT